MAVIVKEINMPNNCDECEFCIKDWDYDEAFCSASTHIQWRNLMLIPHNHRHPDCSLIEIPNGVRLIDANKTKDNIHGEEGHITKSVLKEWIDVQPVIFEEKEND